MTILTDRGVPEREYRRETYYECDLGPAMMGKMTQPKLVFAKMTPGGVVGLDTAQGGGVVSTTSTVGQNVEVVHDKEK